MKANLAMQQFPRQPSRSGLKLGLLLFLPALVMAFCSGWFTRHWHTQQDIETQRAAAAKLRAPLVAELDSARVNAISVAQRLSRIEQAEQKHRLENFHRQLDDPSGIGMFGSEAPE